MYNEKKNHNRIFNLCDWRQNGNGKEVGSCSGMESRVNEKNCPRYSINTLLINEQET